MNDKQLGMAFVATCTLVYVLFIDLVLLKPLLDAQSPFTRWLPETQLGLHLPMFCLCALISFVSVFIVLEASSAS